MERLSGVICTGREGTASCQGTVPWRGLSSAPIRSASLSH